jgi:hypothetical protein
VVPWHHRVVHRGRGGVMQLRLGHGVSVSLGDGVVLNDGMMHRLQ